MMKKLRTDWLFTIASTLALFYLGYWLAVSVAGLFVGMKPFYFYLINASPVILVPIVMAKVKKSSISWPFNITYVFFMAVLMWASQFIFSIASLRQAAYSLGSAIILIDLAIIVFGVLIFPRLYDSLNDDYSSKEYFGLRGKR